MRKLKRDLWCSRWMSRKKVWSCKASWKGHNFEKPQFSLTLNKQNNQQHCLLSSCAWNMAIGSAAYAWICVVLKKVCASTKRRWSKRTFELLPWQTPESLVYKQIKVKLLGGCINCFKTVIKAYHVQALWRRWRSKWAHCELCDL